MLTRTLVAVAATLALTAACTDAPTSFELDPRFDLTDKNQCKKGGWEGFGFKNQGQCVRFVETGKDSRPDDGPVTLADLAGTWVVLSFEITATEGDPQSIDLAAGSNMTFELDAGGAFTLTVDGDPAETGIATIVRPNVIRLTAAGDPPDPGDEFAFVLDGNMLTLDDPDEPYDFNDDGVDTPARWRIVLQR